MDPVARPKLLDLYCGGGGAAKGYERAGFDIIGVDIVRQHEYPFPFILGSALTVDLSGFDAIHASPPCKAKTILRHVTASRFPSLFDAHEDLIAATRERLITTGVPWVIENVVGAASELRDPVLYCGSSFGLAVRRHRLFESNVPLAAPPCDHASQPVVLGVYGNGGAWTRTAPGGAGGRSSARTQRKHSASTTPPTNRPSRKPSRPRTPSTSAVNSSRQ